MRDLRNPVVLAILATLLCVVSALADEAQNQAKRERWEVLTASERETITLIRSQLAEGKGLLIPGVHFMLVYDEPVYSPNEILVADELRAAAKISCGPLVDHLANRLGLSDVEDKLWLRHRFDLALSREARLLPTQRLQQDYLDSGLEEFAKQSPPPPTHNIENAFVRLVVLAEIMHHESRVLNDDEVQTLCGVKRFEPALRSYVKRHAEIESKARPSRVKMAVAARDKLNAAREQAIKDIPRLAKQLESAVEKRDRLAKFGKETPATERALQDLRDKATKAEEALAAALLALFAASDDPAVISPPREEEGAYEAIGASSRIGALLASRRRRKELLEAIPNNPTVKRLVGKITD